MYAECMQTWPHEADVDGLRGRIVMKKPRSQACAASDDISWTTSG